MARIEMKYKSNIPESFTLRLPSRKQQQEESSTSATIRLPNLGTIRSGVGPDQEEVVYRHVEVDDQDETNPVVRMRRRKKRAATIVVTRNSDGTEGASGKRRKRQMMQDDEDCDMWYVQ